MVGRRKKFKTLTTIDSMLSKPTKQTDAIDLSSVYSDKRSSNRYRNPSAAEKAPDTERRMEEMRGR